MEYHDSTYSKVLMLAFFRDEKKEMINSYFMQIRAALQEHRFAYDLFLGVLGVKWGKKYKVQWKKIICTVL